MAAAMLVLVLAAAVLALLVLAVLVAGIHNEPSHDGLSTRPATPLAALTRRLLGVHVRRPAGADAGAPREPALTGPASRHDEGR